MVYVRSLISKSSNRCSNLLVTVPWPPITIGITATFMFHIFFQFSCKGEVLILLFAFFQLYSMVLQDSKVHSSASSYFLLIITRSGYYYFIFFSCRVFHISISWWFSTGVWETKSLLKSPGVFSVFWPFLIMLSFGWSPLIYLSIYLKALVE